MKILYIAKHGNGGNDEEGAIAAALRHLGHEVETGYTERRCPKVSVGGYDFMLCHHWYDTAMIKLIGVPFCFWCFDPVMDPKNELYLPSLPRRRQWVRDMVDMPLCKAAFFTDGDLVDADTTGKMFWLPQGFDTLAYPKEWMPLRTNRDTIVFIGNLNHSPGRATLVNELRTKYGDHFRHVNKGYHGKKLADLVADNGLFVCPDTPGTDRYWSNRVYLLAGYGAAVLHPYAKSLTNQYNESEIGFYKDRTALHWLIQSWYRDPASIQTLSTNALNRTHREHSYVERCIQLTEVMEGRL